MTEFQPAPDVIGRPLRGTTDKLAGGRLQALAAMGDAPAARARARAARQRAVSALGESLAQFEAAARAAGIAVHRAADAADALRTVERILDGAGARRIVKSKSMATEEIGLREHLAHGGREVVETDLGEWIVQLSGQMPSHIIVPAVHLPRQRIRVLLSQVAGRDLGPDTQALAGFARAHLRRKFVEAEAGISGANVLVAETGALMIVSNEGNARMCTTLPRLHIAVVGVEKVVRTMADALAVLAVLPRSATGQAITQYVSFIGGPRRGGDPAGDGPDAVHVVLLDNGRSRLVGTPAEELLYCIRCGACLNVCPVYRTMGGHAYGSVYPGPIGAALTPRLSGGRLGRDLPWASSLCGACREACPVGIQLDDQLIALRAEHPKPPGERAAMRMFAAVAGRPWGFRAALRVARVVLGGEPADRLPGPLDAWTRTRGIRGIAPLSRHWRGPAIRSSAGIAVVPADEIAVATPAAADPGPAAPPAGGDLVQAFVGRWRAQGGVASVVARPALAAAVREAVGAGPASADAFLAGLVEGIAAAPATEAAAGLVWAEAAAAETGSVVLRSGAHTERRRSLLPPRVVFVVDEAMIHPDLEAAFAALDLLGAGSGLPAAVTLVSGPSRSADIENDLVIGVHGPGEAVALVVRGEGATG
jgi:L-lactate dehydrogenase complex protein LldF